MKTVAELKEIIGNNEKIGLYQNSPHDAISIYVFCSNEELEEADYDYDALGFLSDNGIDIGPLEYIGTDDSVARYNNVDNCFVFHVEEQEER